MIGEPVFRRCPLRPEKGCFSLGGPITIGNDVFAVGWSFSWGGEAKYSSGDIKDGECNEGPFPNLNGGRRFSARTFFKGTDVVEWVFVRNNEGRCRVSRLRLVKMLNFVDDLGSAYLLKRSRLSRGFWWGDRADVRKRRDKVVYVCSFPCRRPNYLSCNEWCFMRQWRYVHGVISRSWWRRRKRRRSYSLYSAVSKSFLARYSDRGLPRPLIVPNKFCEKRDLRGVGSWGLVTVSINALNGRRLKTIYIPLIDMKILWQVCC